MTGVTRYTRRRVLLALAALGSAALGPDQLRADSAPPLVILDPGHGGHDPGAVGVTGLLEKQVALDIARLLKAELERTGHCRVMLTREDDVFIPLDERRACAQAHNAALFVSLHADALKDRSVRGASVYTLALRASDAQSDELAQRENAVDPRAMEEYRSYSPDVAEILASLTQRETRIFSARLQDKMVNALSAKIRMLHNPVRSANFVVLRSFETPSVLVEMGFMSNKDDEQLLHSAAHRREVVASLKDGISASINGMIRLERD
ncbi:N-acetylmuramoyl-L-alanine amidase family protein [Ancylobacter mangrovi]|uniref:N-acetylmuramoyl-L-alanine amidase family protein n=1 Tax=Ancylobacter mangrovi TaxID=2972472 RepID=UPI0021639A88|nr:N-acetylmuramoyl-L-alanine amidase [Ancylobacter mangrovi]MCS0504763.1 N-acetylmuramoyl-L-alanine amidase [Ancylobacter mangrovi]